MTNQDDNGIPETEIAIHINVVNWFNYHYPSLINDFHHFANERKCSPQQGRLLKRMGVKKGVPDIFISFPWNNYHGLWLELKTKKGKLSVEQAKFLNRKQELGYLAATAWGFEQAKMIILNYLNNYK